MALLRLYKKGLQLPKYGLQVLERAVKAIESNPEAFDMGEWCSHDPNVGGKEPYCGTVACIAGHIALQVVKDAGKVSSYNFTNEQLPEKLRRTDGLEHSVESLATAALGLPWNYGPVGNRHTNNLFLGKFKWKRKVLDHTNVRERVQAWLKTGR